MYTKAEENYIKSVYHLQRVNKNVGTNELAELLQTKAASVTDMLKKLEAKKILTYQKYYGCRLTPAGSRVALSIIRRHRLWEYFLVQTLGFGWEEVHEIAEQLEHVQSPKLIEKLDEFLGSPSFDPHGDPIPDKTGKISAMPWQNLALAPVGKQLEIMAVANQTPTMLEMLGSHQLGIGTRLTIQNRFAFDCSVEVQPESQATIHLSERLAKEILVKVEE